MITKLLLEVKLGFLNFSCGGGWVLKMKLRLYKFLTKLELKLKLKLSLAKNGMERKQKIMVKIGVHYHLCMIATPTTCVNPLVGCGASFDKNQSVKIKASRYLKLQAILRGNCDHNYPFAVSATLIWGDQIIKII